MATKTGRAWLGMSSLCAGVCLWSVCLCVYLWSVVLVCVCACVCVCLCVCVCAGVLYCCGRNCSSYFLSTDCENFAMAETTLAMASEVQ